jgi:hypothetical protein
MDLRFAENTATILHMLPHWFKERKGSADSIGARFLNIAGLKLDDLRYVINYAYQQCYIDTADINQVDFCYKAIIPMPLIANNITDVFAYGEGLLKAKTLKEFFGIDQNIKTPNLNTMNTYYVDEERNIVYVRQKFNVDAHYTNGSIDFIINGRTYTQELIPHQVWNFFDEFGLLLCTPRIPEEPNVVYKERLLDVFKNPANASRDGLINGIVRELNLRRNLIWEDPKTDLELVDAMVILNSIKVNEEFFDLSKIYITESNTVLLKGDPTATKPVNVTYGYGLEMHKLWNHEDMKLQNELFTIDHKPKYTLQKYIEILDAECPIFWNSFHWNEHYWDPNNYEVSGYGTIPTLIDGSIQGFKNWKRSDI